MALTDTQATLAQSLTDGLTGARDDARELSRHDESGDVAALATDLGSLIGTWQTLRESLLTDQIADGRGDVVDAREKIASADAAIQRFRRQANDLTEILSGLSLPLVTTGDGQQSGLGSLILDLVGSMSEVIVDLDAASRQLLPRQSTADRLSRIEQTLTRVSSRLATPAPPRRAGQRIQIRLHRAIH
ncbi:MAG: hypothetical protein R2932_32095 [Caldilineaceae bacterium]